MSASTYQDRPLHAALLVRLAHAAQPGLHVQGAGELHSRRPRLGAVTPAVRHGAARRR